jgi:hypothetical protein
MLAVSYMENYKDVMDLTDTGLVFQFHHNGHAFKVPFFLCTEEKHKFFTMGLVFAAHLSTYGLLRYLKAKEKPQLEVKYKVQFGYYTTAIDKLSKEV